MSRITPPCLIPTQVLFFPRDFPATVSHSRRCQRLTSISGNPDNGPHATLHTCSSAPGMSIRGSHRTKGCFSGCTRTPQCRPVMSHSSVWRRCPLGWAAWGEFGLRTSCPGWTEDTSGVPWCHRGTPPTHTMIQCNHSQSERIHEFIRVQVQWASANKPPLFILSFGGKSFSTESKAPTFKLCLVFSKVESFGILV